MSVYRVLLITLLYSLSLPANLITDPGFELDTAWVPAGWQPFGGPGAESQTHSGSRAAWNGCNVPSCINVARLSQTVPVVADQTYLLSFWYATDASNRLLIAFAPWGSVFVDVSLPGSPSGFTFANARPFYQYYEVAFIAPSQISTATQTQLQFAGWSSGGHFLLDDISLIAVPEPDTLALTTIGAITAVTMRRLRRKGH